MANPGVVAGTAAPAGAGGGINIFMILGIIILVIVVVVALFIFVMAPSSSSGLHGTGNVSPEVLAILPPNQTSSFTGVLSGVGHNIAGAQPFSIDYKGSAQIGVSLFSYTVPLNLTYEHDNSSSRLTVNITKVPLVGNMSEVYVRVNNTSTYTCAKFSSLSNLSNSSSQSARTYQCMQLQGVSSLVQALETQNSSSSSGSLSGGNGFSTAFNVSMKSYGTRYFNTQPCLFVEGSGSSVSKTVGSKTLNTSYTLSMCLSGSYSVPLNFTFVGTSGVNATSSSHYAVSFYEVSIGAPASQAAVATLPGPIFNPG
ncbi:MAG: hypothetical protein LVQ95_04005 [Candidatus Micrarchaeales archaeon]|nr:hypothetical protein [Candidatus Micrarchaeales archaeon]